MGKNIELEKNKEWEKIKNGKNKEWVKIKNGKK